MGTFAEDYRIIKSEVGDLALTADEKGLTGLYFSGVWEKLADLGKVDKSAKNPTTAAITAILDQAEHELQAYFAGQLRDFTVPINLQGTAFRKQVWQALLTVKYGKTASYKDIAVAVGNPKAVRAVGGANHNNPISIIVPCHRIIGANGSLTGYGGGLETKRWLLDFEKGNLG